MSMQPVLTAITPGNRYSVDSGAMNQFTIGETYTADPENYAEDRLWSVGATNFTADMRSVHDVLIYADTGGNYDMENVVNFRATLLRDTDVTVTAAQIEPMSFNQIYGGSSSIARSLDTITWNDLYGHDIYVGWSISDMIVNDMTGGSAFFGKQSGGSVTVNGARDAVLEFEDNGNVPINLNDLVSTDVTIGNLIVPKVQVDGENSTLTVVDGQLYFDIADGGVELSSDYTFLSGQVAVDAANGTKDVFVVERGSDFDGSMFDSIDEVHIVGTGVYLALSGNTDEAA